MSPSPGVPVSQKWIRSKRWDDEHIPRALWPVKLLLRTFSSIPLAVALLTLIAIYGTLASVPIGLLAKIPTVLAYGLTLAALVAMVTGLPVVGIGRVLKRSGIGPATRFSVAFLGLIGLT